MSHEMKTMTKSTPLTLVGLLGCGAVLFGLNAFFPVPIETWLAIAGMLVFAAGLLFGLFGFFRSIAVLTSPESRRATGVLTPVVTVVLAGGAWFIVVTTAIEMKRSMDKRAQHEQGHWDEFHGNGGQPSQPTSPAEVATRTTSEK